jgi:hypothetical protein
MPIAIAARFALLLALVLVASPARSQNETGQAMQAVISAQVEAFRRDDGPAAFAFASPMIQGMFRDAETFMDMVRGGYPQVYRPRSLRFLDARAVDGRILQKVLVEGPDGSLVVAVYEMIEVDGRWRINGCYLVPGEPA